MSILFSKDILFQASIDSFLSFNLSKFDFSSNKLLQIVVTDSIKF